MSAARTIYQDLSRNSFRIEYEVDDYKLCKTQYPIDVLERNICNVSLKLLLRTQKLTAEFCVEYILSEEYSDVEETYICDHDVLHNQPHITREELMAAKNEYCAKYGVTQVESRTKYA